MSTCIFMDYYANFSCIGGDCPLTCCAAGWKISLKDSEIEMYRNLPEPFSSEIMKNINIEKKEFRLHDERCGLLTKDGWCRIVRECGEEKLSKTCTIFPRWLVKYGSFTHALVEMVCPVVAGYMLEPDPISFGIEKTGEEEFHDEDELYLTLSFVRAKLVDLFQMDRGKYYFGKVYVIFKVQEYLSGLYERKSSLDRKRVERYLDSYLKQDNLESIYHQCQVVEDKTVKQVKVVTGFLNDSSLKNNLSGIMKKYRFFEHLFQEWLCDAELLKRDLKHFKNYLRENYLYFPENYFVYVLFRDWIPLEVNMEKFGHGLMIRVVEFAIIQILAMTFWKEKGFLDKLDYEIMISSVDRQFSHSSKYEKMAEEYTKKYELMSALLFLIL